MRSDIPPTSSPSCGGAGSAQPQRTSRFGDWADLRRSIGGVPFVAVRPGEAAARIVRAALDGGPGEHVHLANAYTVALANGADEELERALAGDGWNLPDGRPVSWVSRLRGDDAALTQVRGPQLMLDVCEAGRRDGLAHYLLGGTPDALAALEAALRGRYPGIRIVGGASPAFRPPTDTELRARDAEIAASGAQVVWVGLGTPKQDLEAMRLAAGLPVIAIAIGAAFDYAAGTRAEAPRWLSVIGLEWAFRLASEPRRLWRRYLFGNTRFLLAVARHGRRGIRIGGESRRMRRSR